MDMATATATTQEDNNDNKKRAMSVSCCHHCLLRINRNPGDDKEDALDDILAMCNGEIVPSVPNLQLFHYMLAYGHCSGSEGVCLDSLHRLELVQEKIYERCIRHAAQYLSSAAGNNHQSKYTPNEWVDTFSRLAIDTDAGLPRIKKFAERLGNSSSSKEECVREANFVARMFRDGCNQCYKRRLVSLLTGSNPEEEQVEDHFPLPQLTEMRDDGAAAVKDGFLHWAICLCEWIADIYESSSSFGSNEEDASKKMMMLLPSPKRMGITAEEFQDWSRVVTSMARRRVRNIRDNIIPQIKKALLAPSSSMKEGVEEVLVICWKQLAIVNIEVINMILFYISYTIRNRGESYVRSRLMPPICLSNSTSCSCFSSSSSPSSRSKAITSRVSATMKLFTPRIIKLTSLRMVQFSHGVLHLIAHADDATVNELIRSTFVLDQHGITGLQKVFHWTARGMVVANKAFCIIEEQFASPSSLLSVQVAKQAFKEVLLRIVHFRCFGTGKRFVVDAVNLLLRTTGYELAQHLLHLATNPLVDPEDKMEEKKALDSLVEVMSSWHCIVTMTTADARPEDLEGHPALGVMKCFEAEILQVIFG